MEASEKIRSRRSLVIIACALTAAVVVGIAAWLLIPRGATTAAGESSTSESASPEGDEEASTVPLNLSEPTAGDIGDERAEVERASEAASAVISAQNQIAQRADGSAVGAELVATGFVLGELQSFAQEQRDLGYRQTGEARVTQVTADAVDLSASTPAVTLTVCVDVSDVDVLDAAGNSYKSGLYNPGRPVKHVYGAQFVDGMWKIATHDIPDQQDCPAAA